MGLDNGDNNNAPNDQDLSSSSSSTPSSIKLGIWRYVLGWDLVPRLPNFMKHVGHTIQLHKTHARNQTVVAYYKHYGNQTLRYAGVPFDGMKNHIFGYLVH